LVDVLRKEPKMLVRLEEMRLTTGDVIEIAGKKNSYVPLWSRQPEEYDRRLNRIDGYTRNNIGIGIDDKVVTVRKVSVRNAEQVILTPTEGLNIVGLKDLKGVVTIGATNRPDIIDEALFRPRRFHRILEAPVPNASARKDILKNLTSKKPLDPSVKFDRLVKMTDGMTGADISAVVVSAAAMMAIKEHVAASDNSGKVKIRITMWLISRTRWKKSKGRAGRRAPAASPSYCVASQSKTKLAATPMSTSPRSRWSSSSFASRDTLAPICAPTKAPAESAIACR
jgi:Cell division protein 48 (CDC48), N-terminal domain/AAA+ lid domain/ATPase family associated with various cellular activities (AAA)